MENLLIVARVVDADRIEVIKIQLVDIAHTWWLVKENLDLLPGMLLRKASMQSSFHKRLNGT